jgi:hypothetical protein
MVGCVALLHPENSTNNAPMLAARLAQEPILTVSLARVSFIGKI